MVFTTEVSGRHNSFNSPYTMWMNLKTVNWTGYLEGKLEKMCGVILETHSKIRQEGIKLHLN